MDSLGLYKKSVFTFYVTPGDIAIKSERYIRLKEKFFI